MAGLRGRGLRGAAALALAASLAQAPSGPAVAGVFGGGSSAALNACAAERAPLLDLQNQYDSLERARLTKSVGAGVAVGAATLLSTFGGGRFSGLGASLGGSGSSAAAAFGGLSIIGGGYGYGGGSREQAVLAIAAGVAASVGTYVALKADSGVPDRRSLAMAVDADAYGQLGVGRTTSQWARALTACRQRQMDDYQSRAAAASNPRGLAREKADIVEAVRQDIALTDKVIGRQSDLAKTFTQARAMAEGASESQVLGAQSAAYQSGSITTPQQLPSGSRLASQPPPLRQAAAPRSVVTTLRSTPVHAAPSAKARLLATLPARQEVTPGDAELAPGWTPVVVNGQTGYARAVNLSGGRAAPPPDPAALAPAQNVREYNKVVLEARDEGPDRMRNLLTNFS